VLPRVVKLIVLQSLDTPLTLVSALTLISVYRHFFDKIALGVLQLQKHVAQTRQIKLYLKVLEVLRILTPMRNSKNTLATAF